MQQLCINYLENRCILRVKHVIYLLEIIMTLKYCIFDN